MATRPEVWVLDSSVAIAWFLRGDVQHARALEVLRDVRARPRYYVVPHLFYSEVANVLSRKWGRDAGAVRAGIGSLVRFGLATLGLSEAALLRMAELSSSGLGGYDATFVALAEDVDGRWLTADDRAARTVGDTALTLEAWTAS